MAMPLTPANPCLLVGRAGMNAAISKI